ncbi:MAG: hypothetical protein HYV05_12815 [Deltaproteobacteria bacterium]|nr:hypothetical protein [Deltaproteobacteria bacterium]MBI2349520.1 hypothetical protein [Deltaproteobacteria bacterium]MBI3061554.1 hypothetical protein [Deltaproteobacteria bacterium]
MARRETLETTLGDLIAALTDETTPFVGDDRKASKVVAYILADLLYNSGKVAANRPVSIQTRDQRRTVIIR